MSQNTVCNPINLEYRFQPRNERVACRREAADPSIIVFRDQYWLFPSKSGGYWYSDDLIRWHFVPTNKLPTEDYAPDVRVINGWIHFTASRRESNCPIFRTKEPQLDNWELVGEYMPYWDPHLFQDDDGRVYLYHGSSNENPLYGQELDADTLAPISDPVTVVPNHQQQQHGWERCGENNATMNPPWLEGAWMTKHAGQYYLQYAGPGTEFSVYSDGVCVGKAPLGPFEYVAHNPFSLKPGGYIDGAGHGSTFQDRYGNWWHTSTMCICVHHKFERRLGLWPAGFDADGVLFCNTRFGDYPTKIPQEKWDPWQDAFAGWMLLSYGKPVTASSTMSEHPPEMAVDERIRSWWAAEDTECPQWLQVDLESEVELNAVQINFFEEECQQYCREGGPLYHQYLLEGASDDGEWFVVIDKRDNSEDVPHDYVQLDSPVHLRYLKLTIEHMPAKGKAAISGLRAFGKSQGELPAKPADFKLQRNVEDPCELKLDWAPVSAADGYNVRWGVAPDKLYSDWLVYGQTELTMRCLTAGQTYWFAIEAFNSAGVSQLTEPQSV